MQNISRLVHNWYGRDEKALSIISGVNWPVYDIWYIHVLYYRAFGAFVIRAVIMPSRRSLLIYILRCVMISAFFLSINNTITHLPLQGRVHIGNYSHWSHNITGSMWHYTVISSKHHTKLSKGKTIQEVRYTRLRTPIQPNVHATNLMPLQSRNAYRPSNTDLCPTLVDTSANWPIVWTASLAVVETLIVCCLLRFSTAMLLHEGGLPSLRRRLGVFCRLKNLIRLCLCQRLRSGTMRAVLSNL